MQSRVKSLKSSHIDSIKTKKNISLMLVYQSRVYPSASYFNSRVTTDQIKHIQHNKKVVSIHSPIIISKVLIYNTRTCTHIQNAHKLDNSYIIHKFNNYHSNHEMVDCFPRLHLYHVVPTHEIV